jgi:hypothetical protein
MVPTGEKMLTGISDVSDLSDVSDVYFKKFFLFHPAHPHFFPMSSQRGKDRSCKGLHPVNGNGEKVKQKARF